MPLGWIGASVSRAAAASSATSDYQGFLRRAHNHDPLGRSSRGHIAEQRSPKGVHAGSTASAFVPSETSLMQELQVSRGSVACTEAGLMATFVTLWEYR